MYLKKKNILISSLLICGLAFSGCSSKNEKVENYTFSNDISELKLQNSSPTLIYTRPNAAPLSAYKNFIIDPIKVKYNDPSVKKLDEKQIKKLQEYFHKSIVTELKNGGYNITNNPQLANTMKMSFILSGIKAPNPAANVVSVLAPIAPSVGSVTVEASFTDTNKNQVSAVVVNKSQGSRILNTTPWSTWADIESSFDQWSEGIVKSISSK